MTNPFTLQGKTIMVTGASSGIGREICVCIASMGGRVIATGRDRARLDATISGLEGEGHTGTIADLTLAADRFALAATPTPIDGIVHSAGVLQQVPFRFLSEKHLREIFLVNFEAPMLLTQLILKNKSLADGGSIIFLSSASALVGAKALTAYSASKAALVATVRVMAVEMAPRRIRANCIAPAVVETAMARQAEDSVSAESMSEHLKLYPLGFGKPADVANAAVFLLSDASRWITGTTLVVDGGYSCQ